MLKAIQKGIFSKTYKLLDGGAVIGQLKTSYFREEADALIEGSRFSFYREGMFSGAFILAKGDLVVARAHKPSALRSRFIVEFGDVTCTLEQKGLFRSTFLLKHKDREMGRLSREGFFQTASVADLPEDWPVPLHVFVLWLGMIIWNREASAAASGG